MKIISFFNVKGGVGKTTSAINVSYILSALHNKKVLLIDLDPQSNTTDFCSDDDVKYKYNIADVLVGSVKISDAIYNTRYKNFDFIPSTITLNRTEKQMVSNTTEPQQLKLQNALRNINYDFVVLDCSPAAETITNINGLAASDRVFIPLKYDKWTLQGLEYTLEIINTIKKYNYRLQLGGAFFVQKEKRQVNIQANELVKNLLGNTLMKTQISKSKNAEETSYMRVPVLLYDKKSKMSVDYINLTKEIINHCN